ncbi:MAG: MBL fold metallo-hydrolase [Leptospiraceae bacterium]|nr:MBL fold metallo-hydrolase [Leptospiraceae bacterium]
MYIKLWGVRGSIPTPITSAEYRSRLKRALEFARDRWQTDPQKPAANVIEELPIETATLIGGETTCVEVRDGDDFLILDLGTGARMLGYELMGKGPPRVYNILLTHTHWDHMQGWPFFVPGYLPGHELHIYSAFPDCEERFIRQQTFEHFPVEFKQMASSRSFHLFENDTHQEISGFKVSSFNLKHPGGAAAFKIERNGKKFIFATDTEYFGPDLAEQIEMSRGFFADADLLVMDAQYTMEDASAKIGWGHTPTQNTIECALQWNVRKLVLTHHEPTYIDAKVLELYQDGLEYLTDHDSKNKDTLTVEVGVEGAVYSL